MTENPTPPQEPITKKRSRSRSLFWPIILIGLGVLFLLNNLGIVDWSTWNLIWRLWPLVLVAIGLDLLIGGRSALGAILSALVALALVAVIGAGAFFADQLPYLSRYTEGGEWQTATIEHPRGDFEAGEFYIDFASLPGKVSALEEDDYLIEGELVYQGELEFVVDDLGSLVAFSVDTRSTGSWGGFGPGPNADWEIGLAPDLPLNITFDTGSGSCDLDLSGLMIDEVYLDSGSGSISLALPAGQSYPIRIDSGSGSVRVDLPEDSGVRVRLDSGSGSFNPGSDFSLVSGERGEDAVWESDNYGSAEYRIELEIEQGSGSVSFR